MKVRLLGILVLFGLPSIALAAPNYVHGYNKHNTYHRPPAVGAAASIAAGIVALSKPHGRLVKPHSGYYQNNHHHDYYANEDRNYYRKQRRDYRRYYRAKRERRERDFRRREYLRHSYNPYSYNPHRDCR